MLIALALVATACGGQSIPPLPAACEEGQAAVIAALARAPGRVALNDGSTLSSCARRAVNEADFESVGAIFVAVADTLAGQLPHSDLAALRLGYLVGAVRKGVAGDNGVDSELIHRLEEAVGPGGPPPNRGAAYAAGLAAGAHDG